MGSKVWLLAVNIFGSDMTRCGQESSSSGSISAPLIVQQTELCFVPRATGVLSSIEPSNSKEFEVPWSLSISLEKTESVCFPRGARASLADNLEFMDRVTFLIPLSLLRQSWVSSFFLSYLGMTARATRSPAFLGRNRLSPPHLQS